MTCLQARAYIKLFTAGGKRSEALMHASQCRACKGRLKEEIILDQLLDASISMKTDVSTEPSEDTYRQLRTRIDREVARQASARRLFSSTWEGVVLQFQNWVYAGSLAAILVLGMLVYSGGFGSQALTGRDRLSDAMISQRSERMVLTRPDPLSQDEVLYALLSEDY